MVLENEFIKEIKCIIKGKVQGVLFRDFTKRKARKLNLLGFVKNIDDGKVEVVARGEKRKLDQFVRLLKKGPILAKVDSVLLMWRKPKEIFEGFNIRY